MAEQENGTGHWLRSAMPWILAVLCVLSLLLVCSSIGEPFLNPFVAHELTDTSMAVPGADATVVVDRQRLRLLFADDDLHITSIDEMWQGGVPIDEVTNVAMGEGVVYVSGVTRAAGSEEIASESVLAFDLDGDLRSVVWEASFKNGHISTPTVLDLEAFDDGVMVVRLLESSTPTRSVQLLRASAGATAVPVRTVTIDEWACDACYDESADRLLVSSINGSLFVQEGVGDVRQLPLPAEMIGCEADTHDGRAVFRDGETGHLVYVADISVAEPSFEVLPSTVSVRDARLYKDRLLVTQEDGTLLVRDLATNEVQSVSALPLAKGLSLHLQLFVLSAVFLAVMLVVWAARRVNKLLEEGEDKKVTRMAATAAVVAGLLATSSVASGLSLRDGWRVRERELLQMASYLGYLSPSSVGDAAQRSVQTIDDPPLPGNPDYEQLREALEGLVATAERNGFGMSCVLYAVSEDGSQVRYVLSSGRDVAFGERVFDAWTADAVREVVAQMPAASYSTTTVAERALLASTSQTVSSGDVTRGIALAPIVASDGSCVAVLEVSSVQLTFMRKVIQTAASYFLSFALVGVGAYLLIDEALQYRDNRTIRRKLVDQGADWAFATHSRTLMFLSVVASSMDSALMVIMARDILLSGVAEPSAFSLSTPVLALTLGDIASMLLFDPLAERTSLKRATLASIVVAVLGQLVCYASLQLNVFWTFVLGRFLASFGYGMVFVAVYEMVYCAKEPNLHLDSGVYKAQKASRLVAGITGGLIALVGSKYVYPASALLGVVLFVAFLFAMPSDCNPALDQWGDEKGRVRDVRVAKESLNNTVAFLTSLPMICVMLFGMIPVVIAGSYGSYIFPLFLSSSFLSDAQIANLWVVCEVIIYVVTSELRPLRHRYNRWALTWVALLGLGASYALFALNQSVSWAILASVLIGALNLFAGSCRYCGRRFAMHDYGFTMGRAFKIVYYTYSTLKNVRSPGMGLFLSLGTVTGCLAIGVFLALSAGVFAITTHAHFVRATEKKQA